MPVAAAFPHQNDNPQCPLWVKGGVICSIYKDLHLGVFTWLHEHAEMGTTVKVFSVVMLFFGHLKVNSSSGAHSAHFKLGSRQVLKTLPISLKSVTLRLIQWPWYYSSCCVFRVRSMLDNVLTHNIFCQISLTDFYVFNLFLFLLFNFSPFTLSFSNLVDW